ncbi:MAG: hypothetical protein CMJ83_17620 [Planctomycetes bacterium]|nr:hypothetical protein [Planctomycetota bacterium]
MSMRTLTTIVALLVITTTATAQKYTSKKDGFSITVPSGFREIPIRTGEKWILAKWQSKRPYYWNDLQGFSREHRPMMRVLSFPHDVKYVKSEGTGKSEVKTLEFPYRNYKDYLKRHHQGGGWFISKEQTLKIKGKEVTYLEVNVAKMANMPKFTLVCIYELEHRDIAVEVGVLKNQIGKLKGRFQRSLKSVKTFKPDGSAAPSQGKAEAPGLIVMGSGEDFDEKYQERIKAWKNRVLKEAASNLPKGWKKIDTKQFLVITHARPKSTKRFIDLAKAMRKWLDKNFKDIGTGQVSKSVIRICADTDEEMAYRSGSNDNFSWDSGEVICSAGSSFMGYEVSYLARALTQQYMSDKNPALWRALPWWINTGLGSYVGKARVSKIKGFTFDPDPYDITRARKLIADKFVFSIQDLMTQSPEELMKGRESQENGFADHATLCNLFVRYLLEGPGKKGKTKGLMVKAMTEAVEVLDGLDKDSWKTVLKTKEAMTESEEEEQWKKRKERANEWSKASAERRKEFYAGIHEVLFERWTEKDWAKLDKSFKRYMRTVGKR